MKHISKIVKLLFLPVVFGGFVVLLIVNNQNRLAPVGELRFHREIVDFGEVPEWEGKVTQSVAAQNVGRGQVTIQRLQYSCSYAKIEGPKEIAPGQTATFQVEFDPQKADSDTPATAIIFTDSPRTPRIYLQIKTQVKPFCELSAEVCDFGTILPHSRHTLKVRLQVNAPVDLDDVRLAPSGSAHLKWEKKRNDSSSSECLLQITLADVKEKGLFSSMLTVLFPDGETEVLPVTANVVSPVNVRPDSLFYGTVSPHGEAAMELLIEAGKPFKVLEIHIPKGVTVQPTPGKKSQTHFAMEVQLNLAEQKEEVLRKEIQVLTSIDPDPLRIPIYAIVERKEK